MRIRQLFLERFGHFAGQQFDFGAEVQGSDFHVIYGRNEAGKSTTMEGFLRLLYGFPAREPYDFLHQRKNLSVSGVLEIEGAIRAFTRLSIRDGNLLNASNTAVPESAITGHLGGLGVYDYRKLLCLDDDTLEKGGEEIASAKGDIGRLLFSAAAGVADLNTLLTQALEQAEKLYKKRGSTTRMAELKREITKIDTRIRENDVSASAWTKLKKHLEVCASEETEAKKQCRETRTRQAEVAAMLKALPLIGEYDRLSDEIKSFVDYPGALDINPEELVSFKTEDGKIRSEIDRINKEIEDTKTIRNTLELNPEAAELAVAFGDLNDLYARVRPAALDLPRRREELDNIITDMKRDVRDLGVTQEIEPATLVLAKAEMTALERARDLKRTSAQARQTEAREIDALEEKLALAQETVDEFVASESPRTGFIALLERFDIDTLAVKVAQRRQECETAETDLADALAALTRGATSFTTIPACPVTADVVAKFAQEYDEVTTKLDLAKTQHDQHHEDATVRAAQIAELSQSTGAVSDADASIALRERDELWATHRATLTVETADVFAPAMLRVDAIAEVRLAHAREVGELRQLEKTRIEAETRAKQAKVRVDNLTADLERIQKETEVVSKALGLPAMTPIALSDWVEDHAAAAEALRKRNAQLERSGPVREKAERFVDALKPLLAQEAPDFDEAVAAARRFAEGERAHNERLSKDKKVIESHQKELQKRKAALAQLQAEADRAAAVWEDRVVRLFQNVIEPLDAENGIDVLYELRLKDAQRAGLARQVTTMEADARRFGEAVEALAEGFSLEEEEAIARYEALSRLSADATRAQERFDALTKDYTAKTKARTDALLRLDEINQQVKDLAAVFPKAAATDTIDALRATVAKAADIIQKRSRISILQGELCDTLSVPDLDAARLQLSGATAVQLEAEAATLKNDLEQADERQSQATADRATAARDLDAVAGDAEIAELVESKMTLELELEETALEYLERIFGLRLAEEAIRRYRDKHRSGMIDATERAFKELTNGAYERLQTQPEGASEVLLAIDAGGAAKRVGDLSKGTRFQLYLALRAAAYEQLVSQGIQLPFFCDDIFETFDEDRTHAACRLMERIGRSGQAIYLTHHRHVVDIAEKVCAVKPMIHEL